MTKTKRLKDLSSWKKEVKKKVRNARIRVVDAYPLKFNKALGITNKILKREGRTAIGQTKEGMKWLNEQIRSLNLQSKRQYKPIHVITKTVITYTGKELAKIKLRRKVYRLSEELKYKAKITGKQLAELGGGSIRWAEDNGKYAIEAIRQRIKGIKANYVLNPRTGRMVLGEQAYLNMMEELKQLPVYKFWKGSFQDRMMIAREFVFEKLRLIFAYDSEVRHEMCSLYGWDWTTWDTGFLIKEMDKHSRTDVTQAIEGIARIARVPFKKMLNACDKTFGEENQSAMRKSWAL